ncbi:SusC/RagA family TonB-linked outer membrane protein [Neolewinella antarctica]|uniref:TonB-linked SusC/RagA family outer membrane protein n=1 Tax=Neolewinella antarctica TaxID=442734 RepID=A0ABX0X9M3_9BACT|nr:TonB-dependent receptor [Neolewinella antarctica]NJC25701.1 TonB-linked SusC/RagA family outer membrane protein [Neolewinella antarctica]
MRLANILAWVCALTLLCTTTPLWSQRTVAGNVNSDDGALPGAFVLVVGTTRGTTTDFDGNYLIDVLPTDTLQFSYIGYNNLEVPVLNQDRIDVNLTTGNDLEEVVVVGYGTMRKSDLTGSVASVKTEGIDEIPQVSVGQILTGRVAGVNISQSSGQVGSGVSIRIRGGNSLNGNNEPLYVVDGYPIINDDGAFGAADVLGQPNTVLGSSQDNPPGALNWLNPADIASIEVLKDASATAIYGSRGANGVIIITTKTGKKRKGQLTFSTSAGFSTLTNRNVDYLNASQYATLRNLRDEANGEEPLFNGRPDELGPNGRIIRHTLPENLGEGTDWIDAVLQTGITQNHSLGFTGGSDDVTYAGSVGYLDQEGAIINSGLQRINTRLNVTGKLKSWLTLTNNFTFSLEDSDNVVDSRNTGKNGPWARALMTIPVEPVFNENGELNVDYSGPLEFQLNNPVATAQGIKNKFRTNTFLDNISLKATVLEGLSVETRASVFSKRLLRDAYYNSQITSTGFSTGGLAAKNSTQVQSYLTETFASYNKKIGIHGVSAVVGYSYQTTTSERISLGAFGFPNDDLSNESFQSGTSIPSETFKVRDLLSSYFGRINYTLLDKYLFTFSGRADGSSKFGRNNRWAYFPSAAFAWKLDQEDFVQQLAVFDKLKLRASYGVTGNQSISSLQTIPLLTTVNYPIGGGVAVGARPGSIGNPDLRWETTNQFNLGIDAGFAAGRYTLSLDYYNKRTNDLLQQVPVPINSGFGLKFDNLGEISNEGFEVEFSAIVVNKALKWDMSGNFATNETRLISLGQGEANILRLRPPGITAAYDGSGVALVEGETPGVFYGYRRQGVWTSQEEIDANASLSTATVGSQRFRDLNGDGQITAADETIIGDPNPDFTLGWSNNFSYRGFDLAIQLQGVFGGDIFDIQRGISENPDLINNVLATTLDYFDPVANPGGQYAAPGQISGAYNFQDSWVEDGSFVRLRNVSLGYNFRDLKVIQGLRIYVNMVNMFTWTNYTGFDPEVNSFGQSNLYRSIDVATLPTFKTVTFGLNVNL